ncbi:hypothetical protein LCGC14_0306340 [marine sediment metagenome]|uniref:Uncharacterized protein n=1 Tax=marine sediment metagenome TaxID=412755 RepID=A0A0F9TP27_9ZZZZ
MDTVLNPFTGKLQFLGASVISINEQTDDYTLVLTDKDKLVDIDKATAVTLTVPANSSVAFPIGASILVEQKGAGVITITPVDGTVILNNMEGLVTTGQYAIVALIKKATNLWLVYGNLGV